MEQVYKDDEHFEQRDFSEHPLLKGEYEYCSFKACSFLNADLSGIRFMETEFVDCNFSNAKITRASFQQVKFTTCKMLGLHFDEGNTIGFAATFEACRLDHSSFAGMKLLRTSFANSSLRGVDFTESDLSGIPVRYCDLADATFERTNLEKADLRNSANYAIDPELNRVKGARFSLSAVGGLLNKYSIYLETDE